MGTAPEPPMLFAEVFTSHVLVCGACLYLTHTPLETSFSTRINHLFLIILNKH